jgi:hypothetical protein
VYIIDFVIYSESISSLSKNTYLGLFEIALLADEFDKLSIINYFLIKFNNYKKFMQSYPQLNPK